ncbi:MAG: ATPase P-type (transporting) HAD superfamily subfamily IC [Gammaproteobacteria bacterium]|nr:MAG: ATPase P-type (transporting) HAD superfamily subfamily IC [Gammaproteobacteria bacterium]TND02116.1 MAG: ATPase, P-type (transporting), HAD superfamily, subfamily IC [Gammaproteobacteria bacterium]
MKVYLEEAAGALADLHSGTAGLSAAEAVRRLAEFGANRIEPVAGEFWLRRFARKFTQFFALILWLAALLAFVAESRQPGSGMATLGYAILGVIFINAFFSFWQENRAERAILELQKLLPRQVKTLRDGEVAIIDAHALVPGDIVLLAAGDEIPADCRLIESYEVRVNNATITGESVSQIRNDKLSSSGDLQSAQNVLLAGTSLVAGEARAVVFATGMQTLFGQIAHLTQSVVAVESPLQKEIRRLSRWIAVLASGLGIVFYFIGSALGLSFWENVVFAIGIIVANVPEGLLPTVTLSLAMGARRLARRNVLIRHLPAVETLGAVSVICSDKTGTLTQNRMTATRLFLGGAYVDVASGFQNVGNAHQRFFEVAAACHSLKRVEETWYGDSDEVALVNLADTRRPAVSVPPRVDEFPFDSERRRLSTLHRVADRYVLYVKGALESLLPLCDSVQLKDDCVSLSDQLREKYLQAQDKMADDGLRVLALAARNVEQRSSCGRLEQSLTLLGLVGLYDPPRPEVPEAVKKCQMAGIRVIMVTGDHPRTAVAVARQIGLVTGEEPSVIRGEELRRLTDSQLQLALDTPEVLFARVAADQKLRIVRALKNKGETVAVTGDGVNDAPALKLADIGIAMGISGTDVAREAADMVLMDDNFASIVSAIEEGRGVYENIRKFLTYILTSNIPEIVPYLAFVLFKIPLPLTVIQILAVDLGTDVLPALGLGAERPNPDAMRRPPRRRDERLLNARLLARAYLFLGPLEAAVAMGAFFFVLDRGGWTYGDKLSAHDPLYLTATTACLAAIVVTQVVNVFLCRDSRVSLFHIPLLDNRIILSGITVELILILLIVYTPIGQYLFGTAPLDAGVWLYMLPFTLLMFVLEEARKAVVRTR